MQHGWRGVHEWKRRACQMWEGQGREVAFEEEEEDDDDDDDVGAADGSDDDDARSDEGAPSREWTARRRAA